MPQFLQSPPTIPQIHDPMMAPSRSWWLDSPLTASVQSPLSVATPLPLTNAGPGPQTPLGQLIGGDGFLKMTSTAGTGTLGTLGTTTTLSQRLEQPGLFAENKPKVFTSLTQAQSPLDFNSLHRLRTSSLNESWKMSESSPTYQALAASVNTRPSVLGSMESSAFGSPSTSTPGSIVLQEQKPTRIQSPPPTPPTKKAEVVESQMVHRQQSCDVNLLVGGSGGKVKTEKEIGRQCELSIPLNLPQMIIPRIPVSSELKETKEEPLPMSAPSSVKSMRRQAPDSTLHPEERKRILHLHAEQSRRSALKDGFDQLMDIVSCKWNLSTL